MKVSVDTCSIDDYQYKFTIKWNILNELIAEEDKKEIEGKLNKLLSSLTVDNGRLYICDSFMSWSMKSIASLIAHDHTVLQEKPCREQLVKMRKFESGFSFYNNLFMVKKIGKRGDKKWILSSV